MVAWVMFISLLQQTPMHTLSVSCHERGVLYFVVKGGHRSNFRRGKKKIAPSPQRKRNRAVCPFVTEQHTLGDWGCLCLLRFFLLSPAKIHFHPRSAPKVKHQAGRPQPRGCQLCAGPSCRVFRPGDPLGPFLQPRAGPGRGGVRTVPVMPRARGRGRCAAARSERGG